MITRLEEIPVTKESYPFASAERYLKLSERGYVEKEYYMYGTANVYETADERGGVRVRTVDAPYTNRIIVRAPQDTAKCSGNVVVEIINPTSFMRLTACGFSAGRNLCGTEISMWESQANRIRSPKW